MLCGSLQMVTNSWHSLNGEARSYVCSASISMLCGCLINRILWRYHCFLPLWHCIMAADTGNTGWVQGMSIWIWWSIGTYLKIVQKWSHLIKKSTVFLVLCQAGGYSYSYIWLLFLRSSQSDGNDRCRWNVKIWTIDAIDGCEASSRFPELFWRAWLEITFLRSISL